MSIAFYMDENVHRGIPNGLRIRDVDDERPRVGDRRKGTRKY